MKFFILPAVVVLVFATILPVSSKIAIAGEKSILRECWLKVEQDSEPFDLIVFAVQLRCSKTSNQKNSFKILTNKPFLLGASLGDPESNVGHFDFPIRKITVTKSQKVNNILYSVKKKNTIGHSTFFIRLWTTTSLSPCDSPRYGCRKFGYVLLDSYKYCKKKEQEDNPVSCSNGKFVGRKEIR